MLKRIWERWKKIAALIGRFQTRILLTVFYFLVAGPACFIMKILGKDVLKRRTGSAPTYWNPYESVGEEMDRARHQF